LTVSRVADEPRSDDTERTAEAEDAPANTEDAQAILSADRDNPDEDQKAPGHHSVSPYAKGL
jgi:hypothetical protein